MNKGPVSFVKTGEGINLNYKASVPFFDKTEFNEVALSVSKRGLEFYPVLSDEETLEFKTVLNDTIVNLALVNGVLCVSTRASLKFKIKDSKWLQGTTKETLRWRINALSPEFRNFMDSKGFTAVEYNNDLTNTLPEKGLTLQDNSVPCPVNITSASQCNANPNSVWNPVGGEDGTGACVCCGTDGTKYVDLQTFTCQGCPANGSCGNNNGNCSGTVPGNETCERNSSGRWVGVCKEDATCGGNCSGSGCDNWRFFAPQGCVRDESGQYGCRFNPSFSGPTMWPTVVYYIIIPIAVFVILAAVFWIFIGTRDDSVTTVRTTDVIPPGYRL